MWSKYVHFHLHLCLSDDQIETHLEQLFRLHGAVHKEPLLLTPLTEVMEEEPSPVKLLDSSGRAIFLPRDHIIGFARLAIPTKDTRAAVRVKRFHIGNVYVPSPTGKQPVPKPVAVVDIIVGDAYTLLCPADKINVSILTMSLELRRRSSFA
jgi:translation initiation factor 2-alpha kinase 4